MPRSNPVDNPVHRVYRVGMETKEGPMDTDTDTRSMTDAQVTVVARALYAITGSRAPTAEQVEHYAVEVCEYVPTLGTADFHAVRRAVLAA